MGILAVWLSAWQCLPSQSSPSYLKNSVSGSSAAQSNKCINGFQFAFYVTVRPAAAVGLDGRLTCFPATPLTVRRPNVRPSLPIRKEGERTRTSDVVDVASSSSLHSRASGSPGSILVRRKMGHSPPPSLAWHASTKEGRGSESAFASKGGKRQPHCNLNY